MSVVVVFGIYNFLFSSGAKKKPAAPVSGVAETNKFIADVANSFKGDFTETNLYIIRQARAEWTKDPFIKTVKSETQVSSSKKAPQSNAGVAREQMAKGLKYNYTGFLKMGERILAIINGLEYEQGEEITRGGHVVKVIEPNRVVLGIPSQEDIVLTLKDVN